MSITEKALSISTNNTTIAENEQKVYEAGAKSELVRFWGEIQNNGNRRNYSDGMFKTPYWNDVTFNPQFDFVVEGDASNLFAGIGVTDMKAKFAKVNLDTSRATSLYYMFHSSSITTAPTVSIESAVASDQNASMQVFGSCHSLHTVEKIVCPANGGCPNMYYLLWDCPMLENVTFEGIIDRSMNISGSPLLTIDGLVSTMKHFKDFTGTGKEFSYTLTLSPTSKTRLDAENVQIDGLPWRDYMDNKCVKIA